ncbi:MAG: FtsX-like permease family protein [Micrococcaceae bacterium]
MKPVDLITSAINNTFRSKLRTILTVIAIFIGAFTLTLTNGIGTGVNQYINNQVASIGKKDVLIIQKKFEQNATDKDGVPTKYDPNQPSSTSTSGSPASFMLSQKDVDSMKNVANVSNIKPALGASPTYIENGSGQKYKLSIQVTAGLTNAQMLAGTEVADNSDKAIQIPDTYVKPLGFSSNQDAIGKTVKIAVNDVMGQEHIANVKITGVAVKSLMTEAIGTNNSTMEELYKFQNTGMPSGAPVNYAAAYGKLKNPDDAASVTAVKKAFDDKGFQAATVSDQIGQFQAVVNGIVWILNGFAAIALLAASFGIINTLLMSVKERTREIGLMKAMGMSSKKIFALFSMEAVFIGFLGSVIGAGIAMIVGNVISKSLSTSLLKDLPGLNIISFTPGSIIGVIIAIMVVSFLAGTLPALQAAKQNPIDALRYE